MPAIGTASRAVAALMCGAAGAVTGSRADDAFIENFDGDRLRPGWTLQAGDGDAVISLTQADGAGRVAVDATADRRNIWWAFVRHPVTPAIDAAALATDGRELKVEARVRTNTAPRRINLHVNHSRTTDFHSHLMEFDLPTADTWFDVSMTTHGFDARAGDEIFVQLALMDWGRRTYRLDIDYLRVRTVAPATAGPDAGQPLPYRPDVPPPPAYAHAVHAGTVATVDAAAPATGTATHAGGVADDVLVAAPGRMVVLCWDFAGVADSDVTRWGVLALHTLDVDIEESDLEAYDELRVAELLGDGAAPLAADPAWAPLLVNEQPVMDVRPAAPGEMTLVPISPPVLGRLLAGRSAGLAIQSHGGVRAAFAADAIRRPTLHFDTRPGTPAGTAATQPEETSKP